VSLEAHRSVLMRFHEEVFNQRNLAAIDEVLHPRYAHFDAGSKSADEHKRILADQLAGQSDFRVKVEQLIIEGDSAAVEVSHYQGERKYRTGVALFTFRDGLIISDRFWYRLTPEHEPADDKSPG
jgi:predicted SnoaL-like aldol condensation-catalyzing enzyme